MTPMTRRTAMMTTIGAPLAIGLANAAQAQSAPAMQGPASGRFYRLRLGGFEVTTLQAGARVMDKPHETFGTNASAEDFAVLSKMNFIPADRSLNGFTPTLVNTGTDLVLFDTGLAPDGIVAVLKEAGIAPEQITIVVLTHMHGDHIGGVAGDSGPTFPNARYVTGKVEHAHWAQAGNEGFDQKIRPLTDKTTLLEEGGEVVAGITALEAFGHTPGHMAYLLESEGQKLMITADTANHYVWSLQKPDWEVRFDADKAQAAASRRKIFGMLAAEHIPFIGYHMPFPSIGYVESTGEGFRFSPVTYQFRLDG